MGVWRTLILIFVLAAIVAGAAFGLRLLDPVSKKAPQQASDAFPPEVEREIAILKSFDAEAYARAAIAKRDFRHVFVSSVWGDAQTPGVLCIANLADSRRVFFGDVTFPGDSQLRPLLLEAARRFNKALASDSAYPHRDVCFPTEQQIGIPRAIDIGREVHRKPKVIDLHTAVRAQDEDEVVRRLAAGAEVNASDIWQHSPLMWAVRRKNRTLINS